MRAWSVRISFVCANIFISLVCSSILLFTLLVAKLSEVCEGWEVAHMDGVQAPKIDEVFIGSCMTNIGHFRAAGKMLKEFGAPVRLRVSRVCSFCCAARRAAPSSVRAPTVSRALC